MSSVTTEMLAQAMLKAVELGLFAQHSDTETYTKNWSRMKMVLEAVERVQGAELAAWRERFPGYAYRPQDDCVTLKYQESR